MTMKLFPHALVTGSPKDGFSYFGPFADHSTADSQGIGNDDYWVIELDNEGLAEGWVRGYDPAGRHIVVVMCLSGFSHYGPFPDEDTALAYAENLEDDWHIVELQPAE